MDIPIAVALIAFTLAAHILLWRWYDRKISQHPATPPTLAAPPAPTLTTVSAPTDVAALKQELEEARQYAARLDSVKTDFVTIASHELRTPLAQMRGYTDMLDALNDQALLDIDQTRGVVANLRKSTERMEELISAMLDVSQLDVNAMDLRFAQVSAENIIRLAIEPLAEAFKQRKMSFSARGLRGLPTFEGDMQRLVQAFRNVIVNAIKFTPDGGNIEVIGSLKSGKESPDGKEHLQIAIHDNGVGISQHHLELIFQKFFRGYSPNLHSTGAYKFMGAGPGLGLTIAQGVIAGHGGKIWAESPAHSMETRPGSTFYVLLPLTPPQTARRVTPITDSSIMTKPRRPQSAPASAVPSAPTPTHPQT